MRAVAIVPVTPLQVVWEGHVATVRPVDERPPSRIRYECKYILRQTSASAGNIWSNAS